MKYIDSEKLIAKIRPCYENSKNKARYAGQTGTSSDCAKWDEAVSIYESVLHSITSLQQEQPEVDLEKEIIEHAENMPHGEFTHDSECREHEEWAMKEFRHFYELGLNARKEE